jgi:hypothetical protein
MMIHLGYELDLPKLCWHLDSLDSFHVSPPADPNTVLLNQGTLNPLKWKVGLGCLNPAYLTSVEADPSRHMSEYLSASPTGRNLAAFGRVRVRHAHAFTTTFAHKAVILLVQCAGILQREESTLFDITIR